MLLLSFLICLLLLLLLVVVVVVAVVVVVVVVYVHGALWSVCIELVPARLGRIRGNKQGEPRRDFVLDASNIKRTRHNISVSRRSRAFRRTSTLNKRRQRRSFYRACPSLRSGQVRAYDDRA